MASGGKTRMATTGVLVVCLWWALPGVAGAGFLTIPEIQYTESPGGASPYNGQVVDCAGGLVVCRWTGSRPRLVVQDPNARAGWGGIQVKGWVSDAFADVNVGDWVQFERVFVEEYRGTTFLQYWDQNPGGSQSALRIISRGHRLPRPLVVDVNAIRAPAYVPLEEAWIVADHGAERFESMLVQVRDVVVVELAMGKARDNYELQSFREPNAPNVRCWASDYMSRDRQKPGLYLPRIEVQRRLRAVTGVLEQYTNLNEGFDYYQLLTLSEESVVALCPADLDADGDVDLWDYNLFIDQLLVPSVPPVGDLNQDGKVDLADLDLFNAAWQQADRNGDGIVNGQDLD